MYGNRGGVNIDDTYIEIRPGTKIDSNDQAKLLTILSKYKNKLYWVENIDNKAEAEGRLDCVYVQQTLLDDVLKSWRTGTSYSAIQIGARPKGNGDNTHHTPNPNDHAAYLQHTPFLHHTPVVSTQHFEFGRL